METAKEESLGKLHQMRKEAKLHADLICTSATCNYNVVATFRIITEKVLKSCHSQEEIPSFEQAAGIDLELKTKAKRSFKNFTTKWVQSSSERVQDIELTEQYRTCKGSVGKYETDRIFAFKLLETKNREMMVGVNEDSERRREFLEDFIEDHPDVGLYRSQLTAKIDDYVSETGESVSEDSTSPKTPRLVHHYPPIDPGVTIEGSSSKPSLSTPTSPSHNHSPPLPPRSSSSLSSPSSPSSLAVSRAKGSGDTDSHSVDSYEDIYDEIREYVNLKEFGRGSEHTFDPRSSPLPTTGPTVPIIMPTVPPQAATGAGGDGVEEEAQPPKARQKRSVSDTHEWVELSTTPPTHSGFQEKARIHRDVPDGGTGSQDDPYYDDVSNTPAGKEGETGTETGNITSGDDIPATEKSIVQTLRQTSSSSLSDPATATSEGRRPSTGETSYVPTSGSPTHPAPPSTPPSSSPEIVKRPKTKPKPPPPPPKPKPTAGNKPTTSPLHSPSKTATLTSLRAASTGTPAVEPPSPPHVAPSSLSPPIPRHSAPSVAAKPSREEPTASKEETEIRSSVRTGEEETAKALRMEREISPPRKREEGPAPEIPRRTKDYHVVTLPHEKTEPEVPRRTKDYHIVVLPHEKTEATPDEDRTGDETVEVLSSPDKESKTGKKKKKKFYEGWTLKKNKRSPSPENTPQKEEGKKSDRPAISSPKGQLKHSKSDRQASTKKLVQRTPSDIPWHAPRGCQSLPRATFINMRTRPLPQMPYTVPPNDEEDDEEDDSKEYDVIETMLPNAPLTSHFSHSISQDFPAPPRQSFEKARPALSQEEDGLTYHYVNEKEFPRRLPQAHDAPSLQPGLTLSPTASFPFLSTMTHRVAPPSSPLIGAATGHRPPPQEQSLRHQPVGYHLPPIPQPVHPLHSHPPPLVTPTSHPRGGPRHLHLSRATSNPAEETVVSPDYAYTKIPAGLGLLRSTTVGFRPYLHTSHSMDDIDDQYVEMKIAPQSVETGCSYENWNENYQNFDVINSVRAATRSRSMEDLHLYSNFPVASSQEKRTVFDRMLPLPARGSASNAAPKFVLPPRNLPRRGKSLENDTKGVNLGKQLSLQTATAPSQQMFPQQIQSPTGGASLPLTPVPRPRREQTTVIRDTSVTPAPFQQAFPRHPATSSTPPPPQQQEEQPFKPQRELPPHLEYMPRFSKPVRAPKPPPSTAVGTSSWTADGDLNYYNVVSKSYLSPPKPPPPSAPNSYMDILPD